MRMLATRRSAGVAACLVAVLIALSGCRTATSDKNLVTIEYDRFRELVDLGPEHGVVILDVRPRSAYQQGHIPGALNIPMPEITRRDPRLSEASVIVVYGPGLESPLAPAAAKKLIALGYADVLEFRRGLERWRDRGGEIVESTSEASP